MTEGVYNTEDLDCWWELSTNYLIPEEGTDLTQFNRLQARVIRKHWKYGHPNWNGSQPMYPETKP